MNLCCLLHFWTGQTEDGSPWMWLPLSALTPGGPVSLGSSLSNHKTVHHFLKSSGVAPREFECGSSDKFTQLKLLINSPPSLVSSAEHIFKFLLAICMSSSEECLFCNEVRDIVQETGIKTILMEKKCKKAKWLSQPKSKARQGKASPRQSSLAPGTLPHRGSEQS